MRARSAFASLALVAIVAPVPSAGIAPRPPEGAGGTSGRERDPETGLTVSGTPGVRLSEAPVATSLAGDTGTELDLRPGGDARPSPRDDGGATMPTLSRRHLGVVALMAPFAAAFARSGARLLSQFEPGAGAMGLYSRLSREELLENETRAEIVDLLEDEPGLSMQEVADRTGLGWGTIVYHLSRLEENDFIHSREAGKARRFFPAGDVTPQEATELALLNEETPRRIVQALLEEPDLNGRDLADRLDLAPSTISKHVTRLEDAGLVEGDEDGEAKRYTVDEAGLAEALPDETAAAPAS